MPTFGFVKNIEKPWIFCSAIDVVKVSYRSFCRPILITGGVLYALKMYRITCHSTAYCCLIVTSKIMQASLLHHRKLSGVSGLPGIIIVGTWRRSSLSRLKDTGYNIVMSGFLKQPMVAFKLVMLQGHILRSI